MIIISVYIYILYVLYGLSMFNHSNIYIYMCVCMSFFGELNWENEDESSSREYRDFDSYSCSIYTVYIYIATGILSVIVLSVGQSVGGDFI